MDGLKVCKLISGEFVIGRITPNGLLVNIFLISFSANAVTGKVSSTLTPYMAPLNVDLSHMISADKIMCITDPIPELASQYVASTAAYLQQQQKQEVNENDGQTNISEEQDSTKTESPQDETGD